MRCCSLKFCSVLVPVVLLCVTYCLYEPIPDGLREPWKIRKTYGLYKAVNLIVLALERLGYGTKIELFRSLQEKLMKAPLNDENVTVEEMKFGDVPVIIFRPKTVKESSAAVMYFHGGGWIYGSSASMAGGIADLAKWLNVVVVSVDYRLSPEVPFPGPFDDAVTATVHVLQNGHKLGIDINNVGLAGDSSGGNLAAAVALRLSEESQTKIPKLKFQILIYPPLQAWNFRLPSYTKNFSNLFSTSVMIEFVLHYLGIDITAERVDIISSNNHITSALKKSKYANYVDQNLLPPKFRRTISAVPENVNKTFAKKLESLIINQYAFPLMAKDLSKVPAAFIVTAEYDILRDDGLMYVERLRKAGVDVEHYHVEDAIHGFFFRPPADSSRYEVMIETLDKLAVYARKHFK